ncbi:hypothetical protein CEXT_599851 [Caerostris extrusa]|uniref:Uncharacterized protein n=1 Tax=Caerostris extrusa TaxID=172846 RepID=A0AAV4Y8P5_CAEEX|nr:hypothetical protein CEXT_599851 [Caerostris extrusa]
MRDLNLFKAVQVVTVLLLYPTYHLENYNSLGQYDASKPSSKSLEYLMADIKRNLSSEIPKICWMAGRRRFLKMTATFIFRFYRHVFVPTWRSTYHPSSRGNGLPLNI